MTRSSRLSRSASCCARPTAQSFASTGGAIPPHSSGCFGWSCGGAMERRVRSLDEAVTIRAAGRAQEGKAATEVIGHAAIDLEGCHELRDGRHPGAVVSRDGELEQSLVQPALSRAP